MWRKPKVIHDDPEPLWARPVRYHCPVCGLDSGCMHPRPAPTSGLRRDGLKPSDIGLNTAPAPRAVGFEGVLSIEDEFLRAELEGAAKCFERLEAGLVALYGARPWNEGEGFVDCALRKLKEERDKRVAAQKRQIELRGEYETMKVNYELAIEACRKLQGWHYGDGSGHATIQRDSPRPGCWTLQGNTVCGAGLESPVCAGCTRHPQRYQQQAKSEPPK